MKKDSNWGAVGIAMALPSTLFGVIYFVNMLIEKQYVTPTVGYIFLGVVVIYMFYMMIRLANAKDDNSDD